MTQIASTANAMIGGMTPTLVAGEVAFCTVTEVADLPPLLPYALAVFRELEGVSLVMPLDRHPDPANAVPMRQITLNVYSSLEGVGLTAAVATALAGEGIPCNMIAAFHHDYVFVPQDKSEEAMACLLGLQAVHRRA